MMYVIALRKNQLDDHSICLAALCVRLRTIEELLIRCGGQDAKVAKPLVIGEYQ